MSEKKEFDRNLSNYEKYMNRASEHKILGFNFCQSDAEEKALDWRGQAFTVPGRNLLALRKSILTDITLVVGPESTPFYAHKLILAFGSPVFEAMFYGPLAEQEDKVIIPDIMPDGFEILLMHFYGDVCTLKNEVEAVNAWIAADKYCVPRLKEDCKFYLCNCTISSSNIWTLLENAVFFSCMPLISKCKEYLEKNTGSSLCGEYFLDTRAETIKHILTIPSADVNELVLLKSIIHWGRHKVVTGEAVSLAAALNPLLPHIRFGALTPDEFCQFLDESKDLLDTSDALTILKHLTHPLTYNLPNWCLRTNWERLSR